MKIFLKEMEALKDVEGIILPYFEACDENYLVAIKQHEKKIPIEYLKEKDIFSGKKGTTYSMNFSSGDKVVQIELLGLGSKETFRTNDYRNGLAKSFKALKAKKVDRVAVVLKEIEKLHKNTDLVRVTTEGILLADYQFTAYKSENKDTSIEEVSLLVDAVSEAKTIELAEGLALAHGEILARDLVNEPANVMIPELLATKVKEAGKKSGFEVEVFKLAKIEKLGMAAYLAVAKASTNEPRFIVMKYTGNPGGQVLGLVGKGLTYDAGGLSIKSTKGMTTMKCDMGGAAGVIGAMQTIAEQKLKVNVTAVVAACENVIAGNSYKPGDIIGSMAGKTIFIGNTDAEGRLTLVDAMHYIIENEQVDKVVDIATLTGAAIHCTGSVATVAVANDEAFYKQVKAGFDAADHKIWEMPMFEEYKELLKHHEADLTNIPGSPGTITAGMFIGEFVQEKPWVHLDIAGTAWTEKDKEIYSMGGTGVGARALYFLAKGLQ